jgi:3-hydroxyisobutyrate dehydrogenase
MSTLRIGFAGLGNMGGPMARNLVVAGFEVAVFDLVPELADGVQGATARPSAAAAAQGVDVFISMLPAGRHVESLYLGDEGVLANADPGTLLIDCSTIDPECARRVATAAGAAGFAMLDAPVSGGTGGAQAGTLTFIVGGPAAALERGPCSRRWDATSSTPATAAPGRSPRSATTCCSRCSWRARLKRWPSV